jgi:carbon monoxide dehydrogenase subunit G
MTSTHEALVRRPFGEVQGQLQDVDWVLAALPGSTLTRDPDGASGSLRLKLGTLQITYRVTVRAVGPDDGVHAVTVAVSGKEARGAGTLAATVQIELHEADDGATLMRAILDVTATGRGEAVPDDAWGRAAETLLAGVASALADAAANPLTRPVTPPTTPETAAAGDTVTAAPRPPIRPVPVIESPPGEPTPLPASGRSSPSPRVLAAAALVLMLLVVVRRRRRRRSA